MPSWRLGSNVSQFKRQVGQEKVNGELLDLAGSEFDALVTLDTNLRYQQNLTGRPIAILVLRARSNRLSDLRPQFSSCAKALQSIKPGEIIHVGETD